MGTLSIVATPIGNLEDITLRALRTLKECDVIYAEDTRVIAKLLARYEIKKPLQRLDAATESAKVNEVIERLEAGEKVVFVSDAGTPGISDPGARLVANIREALPEAKIEAIPGASALAAAISIAGLSTDEFLFFGFLPHKKGRQTSLKYIASSLVPVVLYESPHRIEKLLEELSAAGIEKVGVARELTKMHEEFLLGEPRAIAKDLTARKAVRGEFVVIVYK
ncbi:MAG: 16S rRNA (cytidine(1402)-2'-O)-methyltransferase [Candidatus Pacebacteria bacterium]|nr:16S rRNA (cytidine(1402)-2'-O)-methyltransferase [Candidatus Paceibacterota bacterium]